MNQNTEGPAGLPDSGARSEFATGAVRDASEGKGHFSSLPPHALLRAAQRFEAGALKYDRSNWLKGIPVSRYIDSLERHIQAIKLGDTTEDHQGAIIWNSMCLSETLDLIQCGHLPQELDDREYTHAAFERRAREAQEDAAIDPDAPAPFIPTGVPEHVLDDAFGGPFDLSERANEEFRVNGFEDSACPSAIRVPNEQTVKEGALEALIAAIDTNVSTVEVAESIGYAFVCLECGAHPIDGTSSLKVYRYPVEDLPIAQQKARACFLHELAQEAIDIGTEVERDILTVFNIERKHLKEIELIARESHVIVHLIPGNTWPSYCRSMGGSTKHKGCVTGYVPLHHLADDVQNRNAKDTQIGNLTYFPVPPHHPFASNPNHGG